MLIILNLFRTIITKDVENLRWIATIAKKKQDETSNYKFILIGDDLTTDPGKISL